MTDGAGAGPATKTVIDVGAIQNGRNGHRSVEIVEPTLGLLNK